MKFVLRSYKTHCAGKRLHQVEHRAMTQLSAVTMLCPVRWVG